jgi:hypothetical protein
VSHSAVLRPKIDDPLLLPDILVHLDGAVIVGDADAGEGGFRRILAHANHLAIESKILPGSGEVNEKFSLAMTEGRTTFGSASTTVCRGSSPAGDQATGRSSIVRSRERLHDHPEVL